MKILFVIDQFSHNSNGTSISAYRYAECLRSVGHEVKIVTTDKASENIYSVPERYIPLATYCAHVQGLLFAQAPKDVLTKAINWCDVVHFFMPWKISIVGVKIAKSLNKPYTAAFHVQPENITYNMGLGRSKLAIGYLYNTFYKKFYKNIGHIHCPSNFIAEQLKLRGYNSNLHVISNGINECFKPVKREKPAEYQDKIVITMIGRHSVEKRQDVLINAVAKSKYRDKIQLIFVGKGPKTKHYKKLAKKLPIAPVFNFFAQKDLINVLQYSDLYVHSAEVEIEGISCLEAMACGLVPIFSDSKISATKQFALTDNSIFKNGDSLDLAKKIDYWIDHPEEKEEYSKQYAKNAQNYNITKSIAKFEAMLQAAIDENKQSAIAAVSPEPSVVASAKDEVLCPNSFANDIDEDFAEVQAAQN